MINNKTTKKYFSSLAETYGENTSANANKYDGIKLLLKSPDTHNRLLECGCGAGFYTMKFLNDEYNVTGIDLSKEALNVCRRNADKIDRSDNLKLYDGLINDILEKDQTKYDQITVIKVFHHYESIEEIYKTIDLAYERLENDGRIIIYEPNGKNILWKIILNLKKDKMTGKTAWFNEQNMKFTTIKNFEKHLKNKECNYKFNYHYIIPAFILNKFHILKKLNKMLEYTILKYYCFNISIIIDKNDKGLGTNRK